MPDKNKPVLLGSKKAEPANASNFWKTKAPVRVETSWRHNPTPGFASQKSNVLTFPRATAQ